MLIPFGVFSAAGAGGGAAAGAYELISSTVLGSDTASVTFSSIPSTFKHLEIRYTARQTGSGTSQDMTYQVNASSSGYTLHDLQGNGSSVISYGATGLANFKNEVALPAASATSGAFGSGIISFLDYANTSKYKTMRSLHGTFSSSTSRYIFLGSGLWQSTSAINQVSFYPWSGNFVTGSRFSLYGVKG